MRATTLLGELQTAGVIVMTTPEGDLELDAPRGVLNEAKLSMLREYKAVIVRLLSRRCPFCGYHGMRQEQSVKEDLLYIDTLCATCGEVVEIYIPADVDVSCDRPT